jgi:hypothetical protein
VRVLLTNNTLRSRAGSELYLFDVARRLRALGHEVAAYSTSCGKVATALREAGVPVVNELATLPFHPDVIHGQHHLETMTALLALPGVPAVYFCHGALPWEETPPRFPRIRRYVAVDEACRERVRREAGVADDRIALCLNFVDLDRFRPRPPLPPKPARALVFSNYADETNHLAVVRASCARLGIAVDACGAGVDRVEEAPEDLLPRYDLVFAKARAALEAMAVGAAVIVCDAHGCGPMVTTKNVEALRPWNFGFRTMRRAHSEAGLAAEIAAYDPVDAAEVSRHVRTSAGLDDAVDGILKAYEAAMSEQATATDDPVAESHAAAAYLEWLAPVVKQSPKAPLPWTRRRLRERLARGADAVARWLRRR